MPGQGRLWAGHRGPHMLQDSFDVKCLGQADLQAGRRPAAVQEEKGKEDLTVTTKGCGVSFWGNGNVLKLHSEDYTTL